jgi:hypothetical protein
MGHPDGCLDAKCALTPGGRHFVVHWTLRVRDSFCVVVEVSGCGGEDADVLPDLLAA